MNSDERAPYGSKRLKIVLAALDLYEFTRQQVVQYADVDYSDFDNAKRPSGPLALGEILIEADSIQAGRGRAQVVYTFRNPEAYEQTYNWAHSNYLLPEPLQTVAPSEPSIGNQVGDMYGESASSVLERDFKDLEALLLFLGKEEREGHAEQANFSVWLSRAARRAARLNESLGIDLRSYKDWTNDSVEAVRLAAQTFRLRYFSTLGNDEAQAGLLKEILDMSRELNQQDYLLEYSGVAEVCFSIVDNLFRSLQENVEFKSNIQNLSPGWKKAQLEEWASRSRRTIFFAAIINESPSALTERLLTYWMGWYERVLDSYTEESRKQELFMNQLGETQLSQKRVSRDELKSLLELIDKSDYRRS